MPLNEFDTGLTKLMSGMIKWTDKAILDAILEHQFITANMALQAAMPSNYLLPRFDEEGRPIYNGYYNVMVRVPMFYADEVVDGCKHEPHPMFVINNNVYNSIYIGKYPVTNDVGPDPSHRGMGVSGHYPVSNSLEQSLGTVRFSGSNYHLMTNAEYAGIMLLAKKNGTIPKGNTYYGKEDENGVTETIDKPTSSNNTAKDALSGITPVTWTHNHQRDGIHDLVGPKWSLATGAKIKDKKIIIIPNNDAADPKTNVLVDSDDWRELSLDGVYAVVDGEESVCKYSQRFSGVPFTQITIEEGASEKAKNILKLLALLSDGNDSYGNSQSSIRIDSGKEYILQRGGDYDSSMSDQTGGAFSLTFAHAFDSTATFMGRRLCWFDDNDNLGSIDNFKAEGGIYE